jgi:methylenetetrahydrofolate dehydrogenase (NADP+)/methenyltetrahydrofolate cyclohydrolase
MPAHIIDGTAQAARLRATIAGDVAKLASRGITPGLAVVLVGNDPASQVYVRSKAKQTLEAGMASFAHRLPLDATEAELLALIKELNHDDAVDGILVQLPLPREINTDRVLRAIDPAKDVDGFHPINVGLVATGTGGIVPCTPLGSMMLLRSVRAELSGLNAVIVGRSNIVGKPMAQLLAQGGLHSDRRPFENPGPCGFGADRGHIGSRSRPTRDDPWRMDQARRDRDRRRHQSCHG